MATLSDLPTELIDKIIYFTTLRIITSQQLEAIEKTFKHSRDGYDHHRVDHNRIISLQDQHIASCHEWFQHHERTYASQVSWPVADGLPGNPLLPLSMVNRTFRRLAQARLFRDVTLKSPRQMPSFFQALAGPFPGDNSMDDHDAHSTQEDQMSDVQRSGDTPCLNQVSRYVRSIQFWWSGIFENTQGNGFLAHDIIRSCPLIEYIHIDHSFFSECEQSIIEALASRQLIQKFTTMGHWSNRPEGSLKSLLTLQILYPTSRLDRPGLCRILREYTNPDLEILMIDVDIEWHPIQTNCETSDDPAKNRALLDIVIKSTYAFRKLKTLLVAGYLVGPRFLTLLPQSLIKLAVAKSELPSAAFFEAFSSDRQPDPPGDLDTLLPWLPNLKCLSVRDECRAHRCQFLFSVLFKLDSEDIMSACVVLSWTRVIAHQTGLLSGLFSLHSTYLEEGRTGARSLRVGEFVPVEIPAGIPAPQIPPRGNRVCPRDRDTGIRANPREPPSSAPNLAQVPRLPGCRRQGVRRAKVRAPPVRAPGAPEIPKMGVGAHLTYPTF
ncbi:hypothetical protein PTTG_12653 [Puccinia triticina 1-1 BBBD Race 1]|uniref:Uncharacterized protein n=1 Tax=Puccinia triticina (isolate 1-1 / race 1 (BBBD)) TaxID=630390 RepID=A0A180H4Y4_PUCT1|nr:hypothetical protein PTTG_12653 [Puccinia triticina 1-1 BBBD Race 1]